MSNEVLARVFRHHRVAVMGVVNVTPDSFSDGGRFLEPASAVERCLAVVRAGAELVDVGGESTRPGAEAVTADEELRRDPAGGRGRVRAEP